MTNWNAHHTFHAETILVATVRLLSRHGTNVALVWNRLLTALHTAHGGTAMNKIMLVFPLALLALGGSVGTVYPTEKTPAPPAQTAPDNTGRNARDRGGATMTPGNQSESEANRTVTQQIRKAVVADKSLSTMAKNIKIITANGVVTLRGPVQSPHEKEVIAAKAQQFAGMNKIDNQLEVKGR
jgi:hyperosmotically inducible periplasmic protein